jgi:diadenosine tetraphosphate (Ap4A) HIT family hydrolase
MSDNRYAVAGETACVFCDIQNTPSSPYDVVTPLADNETYLTPALGMILPGNFLQVTQKHVTSSAQMGTEALRKMHRSRQEVLNRLGKAFGACVAVEHGSDGLTGHTLGSGACIDHAHTQLIPDKKGTIWGRMRAENLGWEQLQHPSDLLHYAGRPYIYISRGGADTEEHYVAPDPQVRSQWSRAQTAAALGLAEYDWALGDPYPHPNLIETMRKLSELALGNA